MGCEKRGDVSYDPRLSEGVVLTLPPGMLA